MSAQVTAMGIRDGDPAVLSALVERRGGAVLAYCERYCAPSLALDAASDAFTRFRATVLAAQRPGDLDPEAALLGATRHAAAARSPRPPAEAAGGLSRVFGGRGSTQRLPEVPDLLAARAEGTITPEDAHALGELLGGSPVARSIAERFEAAEEAYRLAPRRDIPVPILEQIVASMVSLEAPPPIPTTELPGPRFFRDDVVGHDPFAGERAEPYEPEPPPAEETAPPPPAADAPPPPRPAVDPFTMPAPPGLFSPTGPDPDRPWETPSDPVDAVADAGDLADVHDGDHAEAEAADELAHVDVGVPEGVDPDDLENVAGETVEFDPGDIEADPEVDVPAGIEPAVVDDAAIAADDAEIAAVDEGAVAHELAAEIEVVAEDNVAGDLEAANAGDDVVAQDLAAGDLETADANDEAVAEDLAASEPTLAEDENLAASDPEPTLAEDEVVAQDLAAGDPETADANDEAIAQDLAASDPEPTLAEDDVVGEDLAAGDLEAADAGDEVDAQGLAAGDLEPVAAEDEDVDVVADIAAEAAAEGDLADVEHAGDDETGDAVAEVAAEAGVAGELAHVDGEVPEGIAADELENVAGETVEFDAEEDPVLAGEADPDGAEIAAARGESTVEWEAPDDEEDAAHLQSASGAVAAEDIAPPAPPAPAPARNHNLGKAALAPAAAVVAIAAIGAMVASGVFGGNDPSPPVDTGIVPERALQAVPEGEAATVVDDLRSSAADARRRRLADLRQALAARPIEPEVAATTTPEDGPTTAPETTTGEAETETGTETTDGTGTP